MTLPLSMQFDQAGAAVLVMIGAGLTGRWSAGFAARYGRLLQLMLAREGAGYPEPAPAGARGPAWRRHGVAVLMALIAGLFQAKYGFTVVAAALTVAAHVLVVLALIDVDTGLLPDALTLPLLWAGLALAWVGGPVCLRDAVAGAAAGYGFLWLLFRLYRYVRKCDGMGYGDFKLFAALGAWVGLAILPYVMLAACLGAILFAWWPRKRLELAQSHPFGPFLVAGGLGAMLLAPAVQSCFY